MKILLAIDGSSCSDAAVREVARRPWPEGSMVKVLTPSTPVMMLTGFADLMEAADQRPSGVDLVIGKPTTLARLRGAIATLIPDHDPAPALDHAQE